jgi:iron complex outermembrane receptor protein
MYGSALGRLGGTAVALQGIASPRRRFRGWVVAILLGLSDCLFLALPTRATPGFPSSDELKGMTLEQLMMIEVTSVSRVEEPLGDAAAAVAVVTQDDIRRSGATSVPEALRLVPGLHVARRNANTWAVSARGFSSTNSEKLLVLSDTRSIYTPLFSGVFWDVQDFLLADVDRIEVIRGPGASVWGSNAVNGVINITTKSAMETQGLYLQAASGNELPVWAGARYGGQTEEGVYYRGFATYVDRGATYHPHAESNDDGRLTHAGFRIDSEVGDGEHLTVQGDAYGGTFGQYSPSLIVAGRPGPSGELETDVFGGNVLARWRHVTRSGAGFQLRGYVDRTHRDDPTFTDDLYTADLDFQQNFALGGRQQVVWGASYRYMFNRNRGKGIFAGAFLKPEESVEHLVSGFVQDQIAVLDWLQVHVGTKLERNDFSGFEIQPSARATARVAQGHTVWAAASRAVRVPTRLERDVVIDASDPAEDTVVRLLGNPDFESEVLLAYELGYRWRPTERFQIDLASFYNRYDGLTSLELGEPFMDEDTGQTIVPVTNQNLTDAVAQGGEALVSFAPLRSWRMAAVYSYVDLEIDPSGMDINRGHALEGATPRHQYGLRSYLDFPGGLEVDVALRSLSAVRSSPDLADGVALSGYTELDVRIAQSVGDRVEFSVVGHSLLNDRHVEFGSPEARGEIERNVYGRITWRL